MGWSISLGSVSGIRIRVHLTFVLFLLWIGAAFWNAGGMTAAANGLAYILLLFLCVVLHEFGHILTARRFGSQTLDVVLLPIGGVARMKSIPEKPGQELAVALAGPCVNLVIAIVLFGLIGSDTIMQELARPAQHVPIPAQLAAANVCLAVFNLIPVFPMDGGRALRALLSYRLGRGAATRLATRIGHILAVGFGIVGVMSGQPLLMFVALFVYLGASAEDNDVQVHQMVRGLSVSDAMITAFTPLSPADRIGDAVAILNQSTQHDIPIVDGVGKPIGLLTRNQILKSLHEHGANLPVADVMRTDIPAASERNELDEALCLMAEEKLPAIAVSDAKGRLIGMVTLENLGQMMVLQRLQPAVRREPPAVRSSASTPISRTRW